MSDALSALTGNADLLYSQQVKKANSELGKDQFLQMLITQLQNQDPLAPSGDTEMIAQMAQFSALEAMTNLVSSFSQTQAYSMIGKGVIATVRDSASGIVREIGGRVDSAGLKDGRAYVMVGDALVWADDISQVFDDSVLTGDLSSILAGASMVGKYVRAEVGSGEAKQLVEGPVLRMSLSDGNLFLILQTEDGEQRILLAQVTEISNEPFPVVPETPEDPEGAIPGIPEGDLPEPPEEIPGGAD
ncbi:MAG: hypothetical protein LBT60_05395 [Oscillospiraceae bacterium]|jgi:flagellar basal-body rod modification protein FlgD|nr:hypothetical protein [Oscillospiraceae bacterium]